MINQLTANNKIKQTDKRQNRLTKPQLYAQKLLLCLQLQSLSDFLKDFY